MAHLHSVYDSDMHFSIDPTTRVIRNESEKNSLVQYDHDSERFTFELPRYIEDHDMSLCNCVEVHYLNGASQGVYAVDDLQISPADNSIVICSWLISANATQFAGALNFLLRFACVTDGVIEYAWHTEIYKGIKVSDGMNNGEAIIEEYPDILAQWEKRIEALENGTGGTAEGAVLYTEQTLTDEEKAQARANIGAASNEEKPYATSLDLSTYDSGTITETLSDGSKVTYTVTFDENGNPVNINNGTDDFAIVWGE